MRTRDKREYRLVRDAIKAFDLNLVGLTVLTEAAGGNYLWTSIIAAMAGANVTAYSRDSRYATFDEVRQLTMRTATELGIENRIRIISDLSPSDIGNADIITNTGFLRPLNEAKLRHAKSTAVIPLMWEPWEFREAELDLHYCMRRGIAVLGTNESDPRLRTIEYLGPVAKKLLFECGIEVFRSRVAIVGEGLFAQAIHHSLRADEAECKNVTAFSPEDVDFINANCDAIVIADYERSVVYLTGDLVDRLNLNMPIIHISGGVDAESLRRRHVRLHPEHIAPAFSMSVTTDYVGPKPVIDLHTAGLKVGHAMARLRLQGMNVGASVCELVSGNSLARDFSAEQKSRYQS